MQKLKPKLRSAGILFRTKDEPLYLVCQRSGLVSKPFKWSVPGGKVERNEQLREAAEREVSEELGSLPEEYEWSGIVSVQPTPTRAGLFYTYVYYVPDTTPHTWEIDISPSNPHGHETAQCMWMIPEKIKELINQGLTISDIPIID